MGTNRTITIMALALFALFLPFINGCGGSLDQKQGSASADATSVALDVQWPEGYRYDRSQSALYPPGERTSAAVPSYVTRVGLRIEGPGMETQNFIVPLDTLTVQATVTFGPRIFTVLVETNIGVFFTGERKEVITPGTAPRMSIALEVNGPPRIESVQVSNTRPRKNVDVTLRAIASDPDPDDVLSYNWRGTDPLGRSQTWSGQFITVPGARIGGTYTMLLTVTDGHGGTAETSRSFVIQNHVPVADSITFSKVTVSLGGNTSATCNATDQDGDRLEYVWSGTGGLSSISGFGPTIDITIPAAARDGGTLICTISDGDRNSTATIADNYYFLRGIISGSLGVQTNQADIKMTGPGGSANAYKTGCLTQNKVRLRGFLPGGTYSITSFEETFCSATTGTGYSITFKVNGSTVAEKTGISDSPFTAETLTTTIN